MNLYLISQSENDDYDTFDSFIVASESPEKAKLYHPYGYIWNSTTREESPCENYWSFGEVREYGNWASSPDKVEVYYLGVASDSYKEGDIIITSFNAG